jgi:hypothetical protein
MTLQQQPIDFVPRSYVQTGAEGEDGVAFDRSREVRKRFPHIIASCVLYNALACAVLNT